MSVHLRALLALALALAPAAARATDEATERAVVRERLAAQKEALALLASQKVSVLASVELLEQTAAQSARRVRALERDLASFRRRFQLAEREEAVTGALLRLQLQRLGPRLWGFYRLTRRTPLEVLLGAQDFAGLVWRGRALKATLASDLALLASARSAAALQARAVAELARMRDGLGQHLGFLREQAALARGQRLALQDVLDTLSSEASQGRRLVRELEQADVELTRLLEDMEERLPTSGFGALRGKLPFPTPGLVEVAFGKVVNPRFNTVTLQKGLDIRASAGTPVYAVAPGKVAYAGWLRGYGNLLILDHGDGYHSLMAHLESVRPALGAAVAAGEPVGAVGETGSLKGPYLYFEIRKRGDAVDPSVWLAGGRPTR
jgi:septal ring factor EnvC (AmiA/AmiB activator)